MATSSDVSRIALSLPGVEKVRDRLAFGVRTKGKLKEFACPVDVLKQQQERPARRR